MLDPIAEPMASLLAFFYEIWPSYAGSIILLTLTVMIILTPLTYSGTKSMIKMQRLQPELKRIQKEYKDDRQAMNEEMMRFYKENQINPLGGCLPLLLQMPIFIVLFQVLRGLTRRSDGPESNFDPRYLSEDAAMREALENTNEMLSFGIDLSKSASDALSDGFVTALPYLALIAVVLVTGIIQQRQIAGRNPNAQANPQQQMIMRVMPVFIAFISFTLQAALVIYFVVSNVFRVGQQWFITRSLYGDQPEGEVVETSGREAGDGDGDGEDATRSGGLLASFRDMLDTAKEEAVDRRQTESKGTTAPKGRPTPSRDKQGKGGRSKSKGSNRRTTAPKSSGSGHLPQPRPRKRKKR